MEEFALSGPVVTHQEGTSLPLFILPKEIQRHIFSFIHELEESRFLPLVCRNFRDLSDCNDVWQVRQTFHAMLGVKT